MGCDIHVIVESSRSGESWYLEGIDYLPFIEGDECFTKWSIDRNYVLFGVLAGVRNYALMPIAEPRGIPDDLSSGAKEVINMFNNNVLGDHSFSFVTLREILDYDWNDTLREEVADFLTEYVPKLQKLNRDPERIRLVFGFDN